MLACNPSMAEAEAVARASLEIPAASLTELYTSDSARDSVSENKVEHVQWSHPIWPLHAHIC